MKVGIFGGTFDPPHIGHLILAQEAQEQLSLDKVLWLLTPYPPHKTRQKISSMEDRISMVLLAIEKNPKFDLSRVDIDRQPPHYASDTLEILHKTCPTDEFYYLMGADSLNDLPTWHQPERFVNLCDGIGVMVRHGESTDPSLIQPEIPRMREKLYTLDTPCIELSGQEIRTRAAKGRPIRYFLPDKVYRYILNHKLY